ncbi:pre-miRNA 5'-monophosphate methyltransferase [Athalia rosae]|uniref:pre-miRNA 5'-monophosphate methyltransferase n=1 Tax=Athalia rosae TaxID=37344 RepID=UPI002033DF55|nr:pre-miRNA 5'-monophosphate methyltransferase [Athalia rosae]XP_048508746.1 pre-miRNA 5'-monophosphate methyltransferase [Athalia rosae]XP_048508747.1 pre-miRNA 5'-monophosphate methyltransferase [Athalia rosae]XP_048508748.1 pre-miRNA 5'-monophosphate methyltransferase [Athalia rosae]XP_048508749.1 pre-miRNA 5'-monophosphate methyltransferase [Athalia rosae]
MSEKELEEEIGVAISGGAEANNRVKNETDPGACRHGNFMNYYQFHLVEERLQQLPQSVWHAEPTERKYVGMDVGCNAGNLTLALYDFLKKNVDAPGDVEISLLGIDLDPVLIERAKEANNFPADKRRNVIYSCVDFMSEPDRKIAVDRFLSENKRDYFDVVFCFSITMWVHLNHGDSGLVDFLKSVCEKTKIIVVEPQPWKCYRNASRRLRRANLPDFQSINSLRYNGDVETHVGNILRDQCGFERVIETGGNEWGRILLIYKRKESADKICQDR